MEKIKIAVVDTGIDINDDFVKKHIKFDKMLRRAEELGYDYIATGHYAVRQFDEKTGKYLLIRPADRSKDQTYVLYGLTQYQL